MNIKKSMIIQTSSNLITKRFLKDSIFKIIESLDLSYSFTFSLVLTHLFLKEFIIQF